MNCGDFDRFAEAYIDGEFEAIDEAEFQAHLGNCDPCRRKTQALASFKHLVHVQNVHDSAPDHLRLAVGRALDRVPAPLAGSRGVYAGVAAAAAIAILMVNFFDGPETDRVFRSQLETDHILEASIDWHRRNLPIEVTGPDTDVIREWFMDKVDFPVRLPHFDESLNCSVLGGRLSHVNNRRAAQVLYEVEGSKVTILLFEGNDLPIPRRQADSVNFEYFEGNRQGYNVALFSNNGVTYAITTELPQAVFREMVSTVDFE